MSENSKNNVMQNVTDDTFARMNLYSTIITAPDAEIKDIRENLVEMFKFESNEAKGKKKTNAGEVNNIVHDMQSEELPDAKIKEEGSEKKKVALDWELKKLIEGEIVTINKVKYKVERVYHDNKGFQAIIFRCVEVPSGVHSILQLGESIMSIGGSYSTKLFWRDPLEWKRDWIDNNSLIAVGKIPPQFLSANAFLKATKDLYNIKYLTGFSLGSILAGMLAVQEENQDQKAYLYNGGMFKKMLPSMSRAGYKVNENPKNIKTYLTQREPLSGTGTILNGSGIYMSNKSGIGRKGHSIYMHLGLTDSDYDPIKQEGMFLADELSTTSIKTEHGIGVGLNMPPVTNLSHKTRITEEEQENLNNEVQVKVKHVIKTLPEKKKTTVPQIENEVETGEETGVQTGFAAEYVQFDPLPEFNDEEKMSIVNLPYEEFKPVEYSELDIKRRKRKHPYEHYEEIEEVVTSLLDDFILGMGFEMHEY